MLPVPAHILQAQHVEQQGGHQRCRGDHHDEGEGQDVRNELQPQGGEMCDGWLEVGAWDTGSAAVGRKAQAVCHELQQQPKVLAPGRA